MRHQIEAGIVIMSVKNQKFKLRLTIFEDETSDQAQVLNFQIDSYSVAGYKGGEMITTGNFS